MQRKKNLEKVCNIQVDNKLQQDQKKSKEQFILITYGPTRSGKSSFVNTFTGGSQSVGSSNFESTTKDVKLTQSEEGDFELLDVPGIDDTQLEFSNQEINAMIELELLRQGRKTDRETVDAILVFESLYGDSIQLRKTLQNGAELFGSSFTRSVIVVVTKQDLVSDQFKVNKLIKITDICKVNKIQFMLWDNNHDDFKIDKIQLDQQITKLKIKMKNVNAYKLRTIIQTRDQIIVIAKQLFRDAPIKYQQTEMVLPHTIQKDFQEQTISVKNESYKVGMKRFILFGERESITIPIPVLGSKTVQRDVVEQGMEERTFIIKQTYTDFMDQAFKIQSDRIRSQFKKS